jgi:hypothetical protein
VRIQNLQCSIIWLSDDFQSKLLSKAAKNPYAQYSSSCTRCKTKISQGHTYCNQCAYRADGEIFRWSSSNYC